MNNEGGKKKKKDNLTNIVSLQEMLQLDESASLWSELCPSAKGAVLLYQLVRPDGV